MCVVVCVFLTRQERVTHHTRSSSHQPALFFSWSSVGVNGKGRRVVQRLNKPQPASVITGSREPSRSTMRFYFLSCRESPPLWIALRCRLSPPPPVVPVDVALMLIGRRGSNPVFLWNALYIMKCVLFILLVF